MKNKKQKELPYRFTCPIPSICGGDFEITEEELRLVAEEKERERLEKEKARKEKESK